MQKCLLCDNHEIILLQEIKVSSIIALYTDLLKVNVEKEFGDSKLINAYKCSSCKLVFFNPQFAGSADFYIDLQKNEDTYYSKERPEFIRALQYINKNERVLEIGSGSAEFAGMLDTESYTGLEFNVEAIAKANAKGIKLLKQNIENFAESNPLPFDVVCSFHVLEHVPDPHAFILNSLKVLRTGGKFICAVPCADSFFTSNHNHVLNMPPHHISRWSKETLIAVSKKYNLTIDEIYVDVVENVKGYFVLKNTTLVLRKLFPRNYIFIDPGYIKQLHRIFKKLNSVIALHKVDTAKRKFGKNIILIATKN